MKKLFLLLCILVLGKSMSAQKLVSNLSDLHKLKENEKMFVNKPLSNLLGEIQPTIKRVIGSPFSQNGTSSVIMMYFISYEEKNKLQSQGIEPIHLFIEIKEDFKWNVKERYNNRKLNWSSEDLEKYGNLTVTKISIFGKYY
jgi:hypothetical protein